MRIHPSRAALLLCACTLGACATAPMRVPPSQVIWQLSPVATFKTGEYDAAATAGQVRGHGNLGVGAAASLDGEMILLDGEFWRFAEKPTSPGFGRRWLLDFRPLIPRGVC